jgi:hypothetical protein
VRVVHDEGPQRIDVPVAGNATAVRVSVDEAFEGYVYNDTFVAEIALNFVGGERPDSVDVAQRWQGTPAAETAWQKNKDHIVALFDTINAAEFGDSDALDAIMDQAGDGAPFMRDRIRDVPFGWRVSALPPDEVAIDALLKLKDPNGIPALEIAALRLHGDDASGLAERVEMFYAYQELIGGGSSNIPYWGQEGWEPGALRSFGEPMGIAIDQFADLYVADLGNSRIQRFNREGRADRQWGGEAGIANAWFGGTRRYYVAGAAPAEEPGRFVNPVDVAVIPGKDADGFAVLDARGRVQVFDGAGDTTIGWTVRSEDTIVPGVGGEGYIEWVGDRLVVVWGGEAMVYGLDAEETGRFEIEDGTPNGAVALKGKLGLIFGKELVLYSIDGFRHGNLLDEQDARGLGYEDWDVAVDERGKLWAVTDTGTVVKYKKPGRVDYAVGVGTTSLSHPRLAVYDDIVFVLESDRILRADALELHARAELAEKEEEGEGGASEDGS